MRNEKANRTDECEEKYYIFIAYTLLICCFDFWSSIFDLFQFSRVLGLTGGFAGVLLGASVVFCFEVFLLIVKTAMIGELNLYLFLTTFGPKSVDLSEHKRNFANNKVYFTKIFRLWQLEDGKRSQNEEAWKESPSDMNSKSEKK